MHGVRGASGDGRVLGPGFPPGLRPRAPTSPRLFSLRNHTLEHLEHLERLERLERLEEEA